MYIIAVCILFSTIISLCICIIAVCIIAMYLYLLYLCVYVLSLCVYYFCVYYCCVYVLLLCVYALLLCVLLLCVCACACCICDVCIPRYMCVGQRINLWSSSLLLALFLFQRSNSACLADRKTSAFWTSHWSHCLCYHSKLPFVPTFHGPPSKFPSLNVPFYHVLHGLEHW